MNTNAPEKLRGGKEIRNTDLKKIKKEKKTQAVYRGVITYGSE